MSEFDRNPREYRSPPLSDIQNSLPERKVWTRDTPVVPDRGAVFWKGFSLGGLTGILLTGLLPLVFVLLDAPGAY